jgi:hypothetical protein
MLVLGKTYMDLRGKFGPKVLATASAYRTLTVFLGRCLITRCMRLKAVNKKAQDIFSKRKSKSCCPPS